MGVESGKYCFEITPMETLPESKHLRDVKRLDEVFLCKEDFSGSSSELTSQTQTSEQSGVRLTLA